MRTLAALLLACLLPLSAMAETDTLRVSIREADSLLIGRSLALLVQELQIDQAEAERVEAKLFRNPEFSSSWVVGGQRPPYLQVGPHGEQVLAVQQLFRIAGQRSLAVRAAQHRKQASAAEYGELAAALRLQLHTALYDQYYTRRSLAAIGSQLALLKQLQQAYGQQYEQGNVSLKEVTRLRTAFFALNEQRTALHRELNSTQQQLRDLLAETRPILATPTTTELELPTGITLPADTLVAMAQRTRPATQAAQAAMAAAEADLLLQRRMAVPDLALGAEYDQRGNLHDKQTSLTVGFSIPLFDRNQGRIKWAEAANLQAKAETARVQLSVRNEVLHALDNLAILQAQYNDISPGLGEQLDQLSDNLVDNYVRSNIKLLEFTDLFESYNSTIIALNQLKAELHNAHEELEFATGQRLFDR